MSQQVLTFESTLPPEEVTVGAAVFFTNQRWRVQSQSPRVCTVIGRPAIPWIKLILTVAGYMICIVPGIIMHLLVLRDVMRLQNIVVNANPTSFGSSIMVTFPGHASYLVRSFFTSLPPRLPSASDLQSGQAQYNREIPQPIVSPLQLPAGAPNYLPIESQREPIAARIPPAYPPSTLVTCVHCGSATNAEVKFCGTCRNSAQAEVVTSLGESPVDYEIVAPARLNDVVTDPVIQGIDTSPFQAASSFASPEQATNSVPMVQRKALIIAGAAALVLTLTAISSIAAYYYWFSNAALEQKLDAAITKGNLFKPEGESAYDFYHQLKKSGAEAKALAPFEERLLPQLTTQPLKLISGFAVPTNPEPPTSEWQNALKPMQWACEMRPTDSALNARAKYIEGRIAFISNQKDQALDLWKKASDLDRTWALPPNGVGVIYNEKKSFETARKYLFEAIRRDANWAVPYNSVGTSYFFEKKYDDAWSYYMKAIERSPNWARPHAWLGDVAMRRSDFVTAADEYQKALDLAQSGNTALDLNDIKKRLDQARKKLQQAAENEIIDEP